MNKNVRIFLLTLGLALILNVTIALAQPIPSPTQPIIQCWNNGFGTIQCISI